MYRIRFHGRGGQGIKTASRILGTALGREGFEVQDAPRYGAERRGAPMFAYVRAARAPIRERGVIRNPDLVVVADESLIGVADSGVMSGLAGASVLFIVSGESSEVWRYRLGVEGPLVAADLGAQAEPDSELPFVGAVSAGSAARLLGVVAVASLREAIAEELAPLGAQIAAKNEAKAIEAYEAMAPLAGIVEEGGEVRADDYPKPPWINLPFEEARWSAPAIYGEATSVGVRTGLWRTMRPVLAEERCRRCWWVCGTLCPDGAISVEAGLPRFDYDHCKGCLVCVAVCPHHAVEAAAEHGVERCRGEAA